MHTGQHYDDLMSRCVLPRSRHPGAGREPGGRLGLARRQTGRHARGLEPLFEKYRPDWVLAYGDTNSTLAAAVAAVKLHLPVAHLEAGLRSFNKRMPEEHNRVLTDHASDLLLAPTEVAMGHLAEEGLAARTRAGRRRHDRRAVRTADRLAARISASRTASRRRTYSRRCTVPTTRTTPRGWAASSTQLAGLPHPVLLLVHPRLRAEGKEHGIGLETGSLRPIDPLAYPQLVAAVAGSRGVVTDSGGLQKEAFLLRVPCTTIRPETEWVETVELGWNVLVADPKDLPEALARTRPSVKRGSPYGDGHAADHVIDALSTWR